MALTTADEARFWSKVDRDGECWQWTASRYPKGYGAFGLDGRMVRAHVVAFALATGTWPDWTKREQVCHRCDNPWCCNPEHLYLGSDKSNAVDRTQRERGYVPSSSQTHCKHGHPFSGDNLRVYVKDGYVTRRCRACGRDAQRRYRAERSR